MRQGNVSDEAGNQSLIIGPVLNQITEANRQQAGFWRPGRLGGVVETRLTANVIGRTGIPRREISDRAISGNQAFQKPEQSEVYQLDG